ncbi:MAG TPA: hypothetical protein VLG39_06295 [Nitrospirota bacterium]|nr:hypothetical protein [Nitrospirota bacterium]
MKKLLSFMLGMGLVLSLGIAYAGEGTGGTTYPSEKMIRDDDLQHLNLNQDRATMNQIPALPEIEGSAPGSLREEPKNTDTDIEQGKEPADIVPAAPGSAPGGMREEPKDTGTDIERSKEPVEIVPSAPGEEGTGKGEEGKAPEKSRY